MEQVNEALLEISAEDIKRFRDIYETQLRRGPPSAKAQFDYAWCLVRSPLKSDIPCGLQMLKDLFLKTSDESAKSDYLFFISIGYTRLKDYEEALRYCKAILNVEPRNKSAIYLQDHINGCIRRDAFVGMAIVGGAAALAVGALVGIGVALSRR